MGTKDDREFDRGRRHNNLTAELDFYIARVNVLARDLEDMKKRLKDANRFNVGSCVLILDRFNRGSES